MCSAWAQTKGMALPGGRPRKARVRARPRYPKSARAAGRRRLPRLLVPPAGAAPRPVARRRAHNARVHRSEAARACRRRCRRRGRRRRARHSRHHCTDTSRVRLGRSRRNSASIAATVPRIRGSSADRRPNRASASASGLRSRSASMIGRAVVAVADRDEVATERGAAVRRRGDPHIVAIDAQPARQSPCRRRKSIPRSARSNRRLPREGIAPPTIARPLPPHRPPRSNPAISTASVKGSNRHLPPNDPAGWRDRFLTI